MAHREFRSLDELVVRATISVLEKELARLRKLYPSATRTAPARPEKKRKRVSAAYRKALSARMKAYWKDRRKTEKKEAA